MQRLYDYSLVEGKGFWPKDFWVKLLNLLFYLNLIFRPNSEHPDGNLGGGVEKSFQFLVKPDEGEGKTRHLKGGAVFPHVIAHDFEPAVAAIEGGFAVKEVELADGGSAQPVDHEADPVAFFKGEVVRNRLEHLVENLIGGADFIAPPAGPYQFVCTFPGHNFTMFGDFIVTP